MRPLLFKNSQTPVFLYIIMCNMRKILVLLLCAGCVFAQAADPERELRKAVENVIGDKRMTVGVAYMDGENTFTYNNDTRYPLLSVFKLHVAVAVLMKMQTEGTPLTDSVRVRESQMRKDTYSPMLKVYPRGGFCISIKDLLSFSVAESDNNAADILIDYAGGIGQVDIMMRKAGLRDFSLSETEAAMHEDRSRCYNNWSTPMSVVRLLREVFEGGCLSAEYRDCLQNIMFATVTGTDKIRSGLSDGMRLAHKTGSSDRVNGIKTADNDAGAIRLADGRTVYIAVFVMDSAEDDAVNAKVIGDITRLLLPPS